MRVSPERDAASPVPQKPRANKRALRISAARTPAFLTISEPISDPTQKVIIIMLKVRLMFPDNAKSWAMGFANMENA
jgi:hypothetical protein